jgi:hypothetical protein
MKCPCCCGTGKEAPLVCVVRGVFDFLRGKVNDYRVKGNSGGFSTANWLVGTLTFGTSYDYHTAATIAYGES